MQGELRAAREEIWDIRGAVHDIRENINPRPVRVIDIKRKESKPDGNGPYRPNENRNDIYLT